MSNILCLPKKRKQSDPGDDKKKGKRFSKRNRRVNNTHNDQKRETFDIEDAQPSDDKIEHTDLQIRSSRSAEIYVCPVVSSSILLRHGDEEEDIDRDLSKDQDQTEQVDETSKSEAIDTRSTTIDDTSSYCEIKDEKIVAEAVKSLPEYEVEKSTQIPIDHKLDDEEKYDGNQDLPECKPTEDKRSLDRQKVTHVCVQSIEDVSIQHGELLEGKNDLTKAINISAPLEAKAIKDIKSVTGIAAVETPVRENNIKGTMSCPTVPERSIVSSHIKEFEALLNVLSTLQTTAEKTNSDPLVAESDNKRHVFGPRSKTSDKPGVYKSAQGIEHWIKQSNPGTSSPTRHDSNTSTCVKKVSDFVVPWKPKKLPPKPLPLKKRSKHLYKIPDIARSDSEDDTVNWTQVEPKGPQTEVLWTTKPSAFDVKLPPLPKRLLERKGSVEKLQESWILPQVKQIETLKREYGRFPGLVVPSALRQNYSVDIKVEYDTANVEDKSGPDTDANNNDEDCDLEADKDMKGGDN